jgi:phage/plasmid-like protein (TIGR03299 family)
MTTNTALETETMVSTRTVPWMTLGELVEQPMTAAEAAEAAGLNFEIEKWNITATHPDTGETIAVDQRTALVRRDTKQWIGIMGKQYPILQYGEAFDFMDTITQDGSARYVAAGALRGGRQGFMVVRAPDAFQTDVLGGTDPHEFFAVLRTSHDGSRAVEVSVMSLRGRCMNQLTLPSFAKDAPYRWAIPHTSTMAAKLAEAQKSLANINRYAQAFQVNAAKLVDVKMNDESATQVLEAVLPDRPRRGEQITKILDTWHTSDTVGKKFDFTGWGLLNATSDYFDWGRTGGSPESRFVAALQGQTHKVLGQVTGRLLSRT